MNSFINRGNGENSVNVARKNTKMNFLAEATALKADNEKDIGLDKLGDMRNNLCNVVEYFDLVKELDNVKVEIQQLQFSLIFPAKEYKLIELDKKLLEEFENDQKLVFRGEVEDYVVLCSENRSYAVKEVETSNSLLLCPALNLSQAIPLDAPNTLEIREVIGLCHHYLELKQIECVSSYRLREKLHENMLPWDWMSSEKDNTGKTYSLTELLDTVQMSAGEMQDLLVQMPVVKHMGKLRWLSYDLRDNLINLIVEYCDDDEKVEININSVNFESLRSNLPEQLTDEMISWFLHSHCRKTSNEYQMDERKIIRSISSFLLRNVSKLDTAAFEKQINQLLPMRMQLEFSYLSGIALIEDSFKGKFISYLNVEDLPEQPRDRLKLLFEKKSLWTMDEIAPYLSDICSSTKAMNAFMVTHCRSTKNDDGQKVFCSIKPV